MTEARHLVAFETAGYDGYCGRHAPDGAMAVGNGGDDA